MLTPSFSFPFHHAKSVINKYFHHFSSFAPIKRLSSSTAKKGFAQKIKNEFGEKFVDGVSMGIFEKAFRGFRIRLLNAFFHIKTIVTYTSRKTIQNIASSFLIGALSKRFIGKLSSFVVLLSGFYENLSSWCRSMEDKSERNIKWV